MGIPSLSWESLAISIRRIGWYFQERLYHKYDGDSTLMEIQGKAGKQFFVGLFFFFLGGWGWSEWTISLDSMRGWHQPQPRPSDPMMAGTCPEWASLPKVDHIHDLCLKYDCCELILDLWCIVR